MEIKKIADLAQILKENQLTKLDLTEGESRLVLEANGGKILLTELEGALTGDVAENMPTETVPVVLAPQLYEQKTPLVGTAYLAAQPGAEPYVKVGDLVKKGDAVCVVESMKMFNTIQAEIGGVIAEVAVENGQIVEYGQVLVRIQKEG